jgi:hypothetical protein
MPFRLFLQQLSEYKNRETLRSQFLCRSRKTIQTMEIATCHARLIAGNLISNSQFCTVTATVERHLFSEPNRKRKDAFQTSDKILRKKFYRIIFSPKTSLKQNNLKKIQAGLGKEGAKLHVVNQKQVSVLGLLQTQRLPMVSRFSNFPMEPTQCSHSSRSNDSSSNRIQLRALPDALSRSARAFMINPPKPNSKMKNPKYYYRLKS